MAIFRVKLQYKTFETGEYEEMGDCDFTACRELIRNFKWEDQRFLTPVGLTCPSVTILNNNGDYLKLGPYYSNKYCLYLYTANGKLSKQAVRYMDEALAIIADFFEGKDIEDGFIGMHGHNVARHFRTAEFVYRVTTTRLIWFAFMDKVAFLFFTGMLVFPIFVPNEKNDIWVVLLLFFVMWFFMVGISMILFIQYYKYSKDLSIQISKGKDVFFIGNKTICESFSKKDIEVLKTYEAKGSKCPWGGYTIIEIRFNNGRIIQFPNLLINSITIWGKMPNVKHESEGVMIPFMKGRNTPGNM